jgi:transcriptional regulator NrdR family protein
MADLIHIVKRDGQRQSEIFDTKKLFRSVQAACLSVRSPEGEAEMIAERVCRAVAEWLKTRPEVTSSDLRRKATETLMIHHPEAAYLYKHHRLVI